MQEKQKTKNPAVLANMAMPVSPWQMARLGRRVGRGKFYPPVNGQREIARRLRQRVARVFFPAINERFDQ